MSLQAGTRVGPYEIVASLGAGGMGEVYRARDNKLDRDVAVKVLPGHLAADPSALARFEREAKAVAALSHPNILAIFDFGQEQGTAYTVTEFLDGMTPVNAAAFREAFSNADIALDFTSGMSGQRRKNALPSIFQYLMRLPPGFEGDAFSDSNPLGTVISYLHVSRGAFVGPLFDASSAVWVGDPSVDALASKMSKTYKPQGQISLLAYIDGNPMFPDEIWLADLDEYLATLDDRCQFERMFVYDCGRDCIMRTWTRPPAQQAAP